MIPQKFLFHSAFANLQNFFEGNFMSGSEWKWRRVVTLFLSFGCRRNFSQLFPCLTLMEFLAFNVLFIDIKKVLSSLTQLDLIRTTTNDKENFFFYKNLFHYYRFDCHVDSNFFFRKWEATTKTLVQRIKKHVHFANSGMIRK